MLAGIAIPRGPISPRLHQRIRNPRNRPGISLRGTKIPAPGEASRVMCQMLSQGKITVQRLQHKLPWPDGGGATDETGFAGKECPYQVGYELVGGPIPASDGVPGASASKRDTMPIERSGRA